jgi:DNA transposition AAA+ family ATPase
MNTQAETQTETLNSQHSTLNSSVQAEASSAHARINIPLNLENWRTLDQDLQERLLWFHQHCLDEKLNLDQAAEAVGYDRSTVFRILKGTYEGSWKNISRAIDSYRRLASDRGTIQQNEFAETRLTRKIFDALDYALANNSITLIIGDSRRGKSVTAKQWAKENNHGRSVFVTCPPYGGTKMLLRSIAAQVGINQNLPVPQMLTSIYRAFNRNRILIVDEAHRLLPGDRRTNPVNLEILRDIRDTTECALALIATERFNTELRNSSYMFEQLLGRIGLPIRLPKKLTEPEVLPIVSQYLKKPSRDLTAIFLRMANELGSLGLIVETLKIASRSASKQKTALNEQHVLEALKLRADLMSEPKS